MVIRGLATGEISRTDWWKVIYRELKVSQALQACHTGLACPSFWTGLSHANRI